MAPDAVYGDRRGCDTRTRSRSNGGNQKTVKRHARLVDELGPTQQHEGRRHTKEIMRFLNTTLALNTSLCYDPSA
jgi:hypothetical protein